jgi:hypothetical protein
MRTAALLLSFFAAAAWLAGCSSPTESDSVDFDITLTSNADPTTATKSTGVQYKVTNADDTVSYYDYDYRTSFSVSIQDNAGMPLDITSMNLTVQQATGGIVITPSGGDSVYYKFNSAAATNHINKNGSADVGFDVWYDLPNQGREALITVSFTFTYTDDDDDEFTYSKNLQVKVAP